jgi:predicted aldo/keto reductase-like oxidoreductase
MTESHTRLSPRAIGTTGLSATPIGIAGSYGISADDVERAFYEHGVNYFFITATAPTFTEGVKRLIKAGHRDKLVIAAGMNVPIGARVESSFDGDRKMLGCDTIDVWHMFWVRGRFYLSGSVWKNFEALKARGAVKALCMSIHDRKLCRELVGEFAFDMLMLRYNVAHRGAVKEIFEPLGDKCPPVVAYTATRWGSLLKPAKGFERGLTAPECYRYVLDNPRVAVSLTGPRSLADVTAAVNGVSEGPLQPERRAEMEQFGDVVRAAGPVTSALGWGGD